MSRQQEPRHAQSQTDYATEDKTKRVLVRTGLRRKQIALDNALVEQPFRLNGDFLYADNLSTGSVTIKLNNTSEDPIPFTSQSSIEGWPIQDVFVSCAAQPGLVLNLWYGWEARIRPPQSVVQVIGLATAFGAPQGADIPAFGGHVASGENISAALAANVSTVGLSGASAHDVYVDKIIVSTTVAGTIRYGLVASFGSPTAWRRMGVSDIALNAGTVTVQSGLGKLFSNTADTIQMPVVNTDRELVFPYPIYVPNGQTLCIEPGAQNVGISATFVGREY